MRITIAHYPDYRYPLRVYVYFLSFWSSHCIRTPLRDVRITFLCCVALRFWLPTFLFIRNKFLYNHFMRWAFPSIDTIVYCYGCWCCFGAIITINILGCLPFIQCRWWHFLFDFHRIRSLAFEFRCTVQFILFYLLVHMQNNEQYSKQPVCLVHITRTGLDSFCIQNKLWTIGSMTASKTRRERKFKAVSFLLHSHLPAMRTKAPCHCALYFNDSLFILLIVSLEMLRNAHNTLHSMFQII